MDLYREKLLFYMNNAVCNCGGRTISALIEGGTLPFLFELEFELMELNIIMMLVKCIYNFLHLQLNIRFHMIHPASQLPLGCLLWRCS